MFDLVMFFLEFDNPKWFPLDYDLPCSSDTVCLLISNFEHQNLG